jgi:hypothetical protein
VGEEGNLLGAIEEVKAAIGNICLKRRINLNKFCSHSFAEENSIIAVQ